MGEINVKNKFNLWLENAVDELEAEAIYLPTECSIPVFLAALRPPFSRVTILNLESPATNSIAILILPSGDESSTIMASKSVKV